MDFLGIQLDEARNTSASGTLCELQAEASAVKVLVIATNEELEIAKQAYQLIKE